MRPSRFFCLSRLALSAAVVAIAPFPTRAARAEYKTPDIANAEALFIEGRRLMDQGDYAVACPKFADSQRLDPAPGTVLNLAVCYEHMGKLASAWSAFRTAEATALGAGQKARADLARKKAAALQPKLSRLTVFVPMEAWAIGLDVRCNGEFVRPPEWGVAIPHDGGAYVIEATADGKKMWTTHLELNSSGESMELTVPVLKDAPFVPPPPLPVAKKAPAVAPVPASREAIAALDDIERTIAVANKRPTEVVHPGGTQRVIGLAIGGAGIVGMGIAGAIGFSSRSTFDTAMSDQTGAARHNDSVAAFNRGNVGTVVFGISSMVTLIGGAVWLTAPKDTTIVVGANAGTLFVRGTFR